MGSVWVWRRRPGSRRDEESIHRSIGKGRGRPPADGVLLDLSRAEETPHTQEERSARAHSLLGGPVITGDKQGTTERNGPRLPAHLPGERGPRSGRSQDSRRQINSAHLRLPRWARAVPAASAARLAVPSRPARRDKRRRWRP